jgi:hypothetical protein
MWTRVPGNPEAAELYDRIGWGRAFVACWSFYWRLLLFFALAGSIFLAAPLALTAGLRLDSLSRYLFVDSHAVGFVFVLWLIVADVVGFAWSMRRTLERNIPGLIWRVSWRDTALALWSFSWRFAGVLLLSRAEAHLRQGLVSLDNVLPQIPGQVSGAIHVLVGWLIMVWVMRAVLRIQFQRSLRRGRIQGSTGILAE